MKRAAPGAQNTPIDIALAAAQDASDLERIELTQPELPLGPAPDEHGASEPGPTPGEQPAGAIGVTRGRRLAGAVLDLAVHLGVLAAAIAGSWGLGVAPSRFSLFPLMLLIGCFSFVYHVLPLTFWGQTPGMASVGLVARSIDGGPLTIGQAVRRWLGALLNVASLGLLFALRQELSLSDRFSRSTVRA